MEGKVAGESPRLPLRRCEPRLGFVAKHLKISTVACHAYLLPTAPPPAPSLVRFRSIASHGAGRLRDNFLRDSGDVSAADGKGEDVEESTATEPKPSSASEDVPAAAPEDDPKALPIPESVPEPAAVAAAAAAAAAAAESAPPTADSSAVEGAAGASTAEAVSIEAFCATTPPPKGGPADAGAGNSTAEEVSETETKPAEVGARGELAAVSYTAGCFVNTRSVFFQLRARGGLGLVLRLKELPSHGLYPYQARMSFVGSTSRTMKISVSPTYLALVV